MRPCMNSCDNRADQPIGFEPASALHHQFLAENCSHCHSNDRNRRGQSGLSIAAWGTNAYADMAWAGLAIQVKVPA
jgi:hypothetical protein